MSVVNDVLKNLNQRQSIQEQGGFTPYLFQEQSSNAKWLWLGLAVSIALCLALTGFILGQSNKTDAASYVPLPDSLFTYSGPVVMDQGKRELDATPSDSEIYKIESSSKILSQQAEILELRSLIDSALPVAEVKKITPKQVTSNKTTPKNIVVANNIVKRTDASEASESVVAAINNGDLNGAKNKVSQASKRIQDEVQLRVLLKENPSAIMAEIKRQHPNFISNPRLLALAAQGQQRSGEHESAVNLYTQLIPLAPNEARWRAGLAISLETLGDKSSAERLYKLALSMGTLPYSLKRFSESRLARMKN
jgi:hypothetical protein